MISILVPNWNSGERLRTLVASVAAQRDERCELLIFDNASKDGSADGIDESSRCKVLRSDLNLGFGPALNRLTREAQGELFLFLNPDCTLPARTLGLLRSFAERHPEAGVMGLFMTGSDGAIQPKYLPKRLPTPGSLLLDLLLVGRLRKEKMPAASCRVEQVAGGAMAIRAELFRRLGGFDERFRPAWFEDVDLCRRAIDAGAETWFVPGAAVCHEGGYSAGQLGYEGLLSLYYTNMMRYVEKHLTGWTGLLRLAIIVGMGLRMVAAIIVPGAAGQTRATALRAYRRVIGRAFAGVEQKQPDRSGNPMQ